MPLTECRGIITHRAVDKATGWLRLGVRFQKTPAALGRRIHRMMTDDEACEARVAESGAARCDVTCSFHSLCSKPIREDSAAAAPSQFEIALQRPHRASR